MNETQEEQNSYELLKNLSDEAERLARRYPTRL
jgi:hypothetical protein